MARPRTAARLAAVQALYQIEQAGLPAAAVIAEFRSHRLAPAGDYEEGGAPEADAGFFARLVEATIARQEASDAAIAPVLPREWPLARLDPVLRALLRAAAGELADPAGPPARVVINEYLDVAHGFFAGEEPRLANGALDALARRLRPAEFADLPG